MTQDKKPKVNSEGQKELNKVAEQFEMFDDQVKSLTLDRMNEAPKQDVEPQTKMAQSEIQNSKDIYLKPKRTISSQEKFNEKYREDYNFAKQYVQFIAEHKELIGETIDLWTKDFAGIPAEEWAVPTGKPVWGPRYLAERIRKCRHHRLSMQNTVSTGYDQNGQYYGTMVVDNIVQRLDAYPVSTRKSIFMGDNEFSVKRAA
jgi:hypothetical protein